MSKEYSSDHKHKGGDIAIVGMASQFPDAESLYDFWTNIVNKKDSIIDIDETLKDEYWKKEDYYSPDFFAKDRTYSSKAGFIPPMNFNPVEFKIPPAALDSISNVQLYALYVAKLAMSDAGYSTASNDWGVDRERFGVILGGAGNGSISYSLSARNQAPSLKKIMLSSGLSEDVADEVLERANSCYHEWNEDCFPGFLGNVACGRICSHFDLGGTSYMVDAACASSFAAVKAAIAELQDGSCDAVLTGGINIENSMFSFLCFSKTPALSRKNVSRPFDTDADGMMLGDGVGFLILKRLEDAEKAGDKIYAVIDSIAASSDGRAKSVFAPRKEGQIKAVTRAYELSDVSPADIQLIEAHGTGTVQGDFTEIGSLTEVFTAANVEPKSIAIGSIKSQIGHTRCAAGAAAMIKVALALHHKVLPPTINVDKPDSNLFGENSPFYVNTQARPWLASESGKLRHAALSSFGFGGTNFHVIMREHKAKTDTQYRLKELPAVLSFQAETAEKLIEQCESALADLVKAATLNEASTVGVNFIGVNIKAKHTTAEEGLSKLVHAQKNITIAPNMPRIAFAVDNPHTAISLLEMGIARLRDESKTAWENPKGIYYRPFADTQLGKTVALFPGQGSQYVNMAQEVANDFPEMREELEKLNMYSIEERGQSIADCIHPVPAFTAGELNQQIEHLTQTENAQPAIGAVSAGYFNVFKSMGFKADMIAGHSYGEVTALWASGVLSDKEFYRVSLSRGSAAALAANQPGKESSTMLAAPLNTVQLTELLNQFPDLVVANFNSQEQTVIGGTISSIKAANSYLSTQKIQSQILNVAAAFHTPFIHDAYEPFKAKLADVKFRSPKQVLYSTATAACYSSKPKDIRDALAEQLITPVRFKETIENMYEQGGRVFVEFGPKGVLGKLVGTILKDKPHTVVSVNNSPKGNDRLQLMKAIAKLAVLGVNFNSSDRYLRPRQFADISKSLTFRIGGGLLVMDRQRNAIEHALTTETTVVDKFIQEKIAENKGESTIEPCVATVKTEQKAVRVEQPKREDNKRNEGAIMTNSMGKSSNNNVAQGQYVTQQPTRSTNNMESRLDLLMGSQQSVNMIHEQFQVNQKEYIHLLDSLLSKQYELMDKFQSDVQLPNVLSSLGQSVQLLDRSLDMYHANHERYFETQQGLLHIELGQDLPARLPSRAPRQVIVRAVPQVAQQQTVQYVAPQPVEQHYVQPVTAAQPAPVAQKVEPVVVSVLPVAHVIVEQALPVKTAPIAIQGEVLDSKPSTRKRDLTPEMLEKLEEMSVMSHGELVEQLIDVVSNKTGYPKEMITADMDLEADLGIDSIKRLEIFGAMSEEFSADADMYQSLSDNDEMASFDIESLSNIDKMAVFFKSTVKDLLAEHNGEHVASVAAIAHDEIVIDDVPPVVAVASAPLNESNHSLDKFGFTVSTDDAEVAAVKKSKTEEQSNTVIEHDAPASSVKRYSVTKEVLSKPDQLELRLEEGYIWLVVDEGKTAASDVIRSLRKKGHNVAHLLVGGDNIKQAAKPGQYQLKSSSELTVFETFTTIEQKEGKIGGILYLKAESQAVTSVNGLFVKTDYDMIETCYALAKRFQANISGKVDGWRYFFVITRFDGELATSGKTLMPIVGAGITGLTKSLKYEWNNVFSRMVDIAPGVNDSHAAAMIIEELQDNNKEIAEVGRDLQGKRMTLSLADATHQPVDACLIDENSVFLVTGGARGITALCITKLAAQSKSTFLLLGRTDIHALLPEWASGSMSEKAFKAAAMTHLVASGEKPTPVKINALYAQVSNTSEISQTLRAIEQVGGKAHYICCDINDANSTANAIKEAQKQFPLITGIIHGAGNLADKRIEKKTEENFHSVFNTKVKGLENVLNACDFSTLTDIIVFSSVVGFFGNAGQTDYSLANEVLNKFVNLPLQAKNSHLRVKSINWGPWDGGMVTDTLKKFYDAYNKVIIPLETGSDMFVRELSYATPHQIIIGGNDYKGLPPKMKKEELERDVKRSITVNDNPFMHNHVIKERFVLPCSAAINWMVQLAEEKIPGYVINEVIDFSIPNGLVFDPKTTHDYTAKLERIVLPGLADGQVAINVMVTSPLQIDNLLKKHYDATLVMGPSACEAPLMPVAVDLTQHVTLDKSIYGDMTLDGLTFHGPAFQGIQHVVSISDDMAVMKCCLPAVPVETQGQFRVNSFNYFIADVSLHAVLVWTMLKTQGIGLPTSIGRIEMFEPIGFDQTFYVTITVKNKNKTKTSIVTDLVLHDELGHVYAKLHDFSLVVSQSLRTELCNQ